MLQICPWIGYVVMFIIGLAVGDALCLEKLRKKFPDLYRTMRTRKLDEELAMRTRKLKKELTSVCDPAHDPK